MARKRLTRVESKAQTRAYLLDAAATLIRRHGFEGTSVEQIAEEAGYTKGALYTHFEGKEDLFVALLEETVRAEIADLHRRFAAQESPRARYATLRELCVSMGQDLDATLLNTELRLAGARNETLRAKLAPLTDELHGSFAAIIGGTAGDAGVALPLPPADIASLVLVSGGGISLQRAVAPRTVSDGLARSAIALLLPPLPDAPSATRH